LCCSENGDFAVLVQRIAGWSTGGVGHFKKAKLRSEAIAGANIIVFNRPILSLAQDDTHALQLRHHHFDCEHAITRV